MRARVEVVIRSGGRKHIESACSTAIDLGAQSLHEIEGAVEIWKQQVLPEIEADLLSQAQNQFTQQKKKGSLAVTARGSVWIKEVRSEEIELDPHDSSLLNYVGGISSADLAIRADPFK